MSKFENSGNRARIGIITGAGPEAGLDLWQKIIRINRERLGATFRGDIDAPDVTIFSVPELANAMSLRDCQDELWLVLEATVREISAHVDAFGIACNVLHLFADRIRNMNDASELVSIVEATAAHLEGAGIENAGLLSIPAVMSLDQFSPYRALRNSLNIELPDKFEKVENIVKRVKQFGAQDPEARRQYLDVISKFDSETVILACTELPLLAADGDGKSIIDPTSLLAKALVDRVYE